MNQHNQNNQPPSKTNLFLALTISVKKSFAADPSYTTILKLFVENKIRIKTPVKSTNNPMRYL